MSKSFIYRYNHEDKFSKDLQHSCKSIYDRFHFELVHQ